MIVRRWQASIVPDKSQIISMYTAEGLTADEETIPANREIPIHRHPFDEVRTVVSGEMILDIAGNKLLLRAGDRIVIPANTRHSYKAQGTEDCLSLTALKTF